MSPDVRNRLTEIISAGLVSGLGTPEPGKLCIEAAVCLALGEPHGDKPSCVAEPDREFGIRLNDASWSSDAARAEALLPLALAQLGTAGTDRSAWVERLVVGTVRRVLPIALRAVGLHDQADRCAGAVTLAECRDAAYSANAAANAYSDDDDYAPAHAAAYSAHAAASRAAEAAKAAYAASRAALAAAHAAYAAAGDSVLRESAAVALDAYRADC